MGKVTWFLIAVVGLCAGAAAAVVLWRGETRSGVDVADVLPQDVVYYFEARDVRGLVDGVASTEAWSDLQDSGLLDAADEGEGLAKLAATLEDVSARIDYPLDGDAALKLLGERAALALTVDEARDVHWTFVTRIDAEQLALDLLGGELDREALEQEMLARAERAELTVTRVERGEYVVATLTQGETTVHATLLEDVLVVADEVSAIEAAVDLRVASGEGALSRLPAFGDELGRLPEGAHVRDWISLARLRDVGPIRLRVGRGGDDEPVFDASGMLDEIEGDAVARAIELPDHDLYSLRWTWSREGSALFADGASPPLHEVLPADPLMTLRVQRLGELPDAWERSALKRHLANSWFARQIDDLGERLESLGERFDAPMDGDGAKLASSTFVRRLGWHLLRQSFASGLGGDGALAAWAEPGEETPRVLIAVRLGTDGRMAELGVRSLADQGAGDVEMRAVQHAGRTIRTSLRDLDGSSFGWTTIGDMLLVANHVDVLRAAVERATAGDGAPPPIGPVLPDDFRVRVDVSMRRYLDFAEELAGDDPQLDDAMEMLRTSTPYDRVAVAGYVADDLSRIELRVASSGGDPAKSPILRAELNVAPGAPRMFDVLPDSVVYVLGSRLDLETAVDAMATDLPGPLVEPVREGLAEIEARIEMDLSETVVPALGDEIGMACLYNDEPASPDAPVIPGVAVLVRIDDVPPVASLLHRLADFADEAMAQDAAAPRIERDEAGGRPVFRIVDRGPRVVVPVVTFVGDYLVVALDESVHEALLAVRDGTTPSHAASPLATRIRAAGLSPDGTSMVRLDWNRLIDQVEVYAPQLAQAFVSDDVAPSPAWPQNGDIEEWERRVAEYEKARAAAAESKVGEVRDVLASLRVIDFVASSAVTRPDGFEGHVVIRFLD